MSNFTLSQLLEARKRKLSGLGCSDHDRQLCDLFAVASSFAAHAYEGSGLGGAEVDALGVAFLTALTDPLSPDLDYLRKDPQAGAKARAEREGMAEAFHFSAGYEAGEREAQRSAYHLCEIFGTLDEYEEMPCSSLRERLIEAVCRARRELRGKAAALTEQPVAQEPVEGIPERIWADPDNLTWVEADPNEVMRKDEVCYIRADLAHPATPAQPVAQEPVAFRFKHEHLPNEWKFAENPHRGKPWMGFEPLYAHPATPAPVAAYCGCEPRVTTHSLVTGRITCNHCAADLGSIATPAPVEAGLREEIAALEARNQQLLADHSHIFSRLEKATARWMDLVEAPDPKHGPFLVSNNPNAVNAHGRPSHVWCVGSIHKSANGEFVAFTDADRKIHGLKVFMAVPALRAQSAPVAAPICEKSKTADLPPPGWADGEGS